MVRIAGSNFACKRVGSSLVCMPGFSIHRRACPALPQNVRRIFRNKRTHFLSKTNNDEMNDGARLHKHGVGEWQNECARTKSEIPAPRPGPAFGARRTDRKPDGGISRRGRPTNVMLRAWCSEGNNNEGVMESVRIRVHFEDEIEGLFCR